MNKKLSDANKGKKVVNHGETVAPCSERPKPGFPYKEEDYYMSEEDLKKELFGFDGAVVFNLLSMDNKMKLKYRPEELEQEDQ